MYAPAVLTVLVVDEDATARNALRETLEVVGHLVFEVPDVEGALRLLDESAEPVVTLFSVELPRFTMSGLDAARLIGVLLERHDLAARHAFVAISAHPENVSAVLGRVLARLGVPVIAASSSPATLREVVARAAHRLQGAPAMCGS